MRLLLRANAHRPVDGVGWELAASPDTPRREAWQWDVRVVEHPSTVVEGQAGVERQAVGLPRGDGTSSVLQVSCDPAAVAGKVDVMIAGEPATIERVPHEVLVLVVGHGAALLEGRHLLRELDAMVLEGDDPPVLSVRREGDEPTSVGVVRLRSAGARAISWVP